tara:strand:- start:789 stop:977 length:189 start_codon:yes stop_codon:yes gene_type:complete
MNKLNPILFKNKFAIELLPAETLLGIKSVNCEVLCDDDIYRQVTGVEIGLIFIKLSYVNIQF